MSTASLYALQIVDTELDTRRKRLAEVEKALGESESLRQARQAFAEAEKVLGTAQKQQRHFEQETQTQELKIKQAEDQLYSGRIRNPKEASALQDNIASMKRHKSALEDSVLDAMAEAESAAQILTNCRQTLAEVQGSWEHAQSDLLKERNTLQSRITELSAARSKTVATISAPDLSLYTDLRQRKGGRAVVTVQGNRCSVCGVTVPTAQVQQLRNSRTLSFCSSCSRILYIT